MGEQQTKKELDYKDVENGPLTEANRECRDIFCCLFFIINIIWMCYATGVAYNTGNPTRIYRAVATNGNICGYPGNTAEAFPYAYYSNPTDMAAHRYCVAACPMGTDTTMATSGGAVTLNIQIDSSGTATPATAWTSSTQLAYDSSVAFDRICIPSTAAFTGALASYASTFASLNEGELGNFILDVKNNWKWLLLAFFFAIILAFVFMFCLRCLAGCIVWCSVIGIIFVFAAGGIVFLYNAGLITGFGNYSGYLSIPNSSASQDSYKVYGFISFGLSGLFLILTLCCCSRLRLAVAVCKAAGQFIVGVCTAMLVPIFQTLFTLALWGGCLVVMVFLVSTATFKVASSSDYFTSVSSYSDGGLVNLYIFIFSTLWSNALIQAIGIFVIASACCMWYYAQGSAGEPLEFPILRSYKMAFRFHFGSLAFGSLILAIVQFLELMVEAFKRQAESAGGDNKCTKALINCIQCCLACVERIVEFINKTAYIQIAIRGKSFCYAAKDGFEMVFSNVLRYSIVSGVGSILMFIGKLMIAASTTGCFYLLILYTPSIRANVLQPIYLLIIVFIMGFAVAMLFMTVYTLAMDTLLACFIVDQANSKGKGGKPQHAPPELAELMDTD